MWKLVLLAVFCPLLFGQAIVESAAIAAAGAAGSSKAGSGIGTGLTKSLSGISGKLQTAAQAGSSAPASSAQATGVPALSKADEKNARVEEKKGLPDVALLKVGMTRAELEKVAGKPSQMISLPEDGKLQERYKYLAGDKELRLVLVDGIVREIKP